MLFGSKFPSFIFCELQSLFKIQYDYFYLSVFRFILRSFKLQFYSIFCSFRPLNDFARLSIFRLFLLFTKLIDAFLSFSIQIAIGY